MLAADIARCIGKGTDAGQPRPPVVIPMRTGQGQNDREHWATKSRRVKKERGDTRWAVRAGFGPALPDMLPCIVTLTRVAPSSGLDGDNLQGSLKAPRDGVADWLGVDDRDPRVTWRYEQRRGKPKEWAVEVHLS